MQDDVGRLIASLGISDAPLVRRGAQEALAFFCTRVRTDPFQWLDYLKGSDFRSETRQVVLPAGVALARFEQLEGPGRPKPFSYFTRPDTSEQLGTSCQAYRFRLFQTARNTPALLTRAADIAFVGRIRPGGGISTYPGVIRCPSASARGPENTPLLNLECERSWKTRRAFL